MNSEDQLLMDAVLKRSDAIKLLYEKHAPSLLSLCMRYCGNIEDAEDVLHDGFIKIIKHLHTFKPRNNGSFHGWMKRIMVNTALNFIRDKSRVRKLFEPEPAFERISVIEEDDSYFSLLSDKVETKIVMDLICELPNGYRTVFNLYVFESYSHKEIANTLNCSENTSKSQLSKARQWLRNKVNQLVLKQEA